MCDRIKRGLKMLTLIKGPLDGLPLGDFIVDDSDKAIFDEALEVGFYGIEVQGHSWSGEGRATVINATP